MNISKIRKTDDNTLFRFLSKSYGKNRPVLNSKTLSIDNNASKKHISSSRKPRIRSVSSAIYDTSSPNKNIG